MKKIASLWIAILVAAAGHSQVVAEGHSLLARLDSIRNSPSVSRYFAAIYFETSGIATRFFATRDDRVKYMMGRLETRFASYFFHAAEAYQQHAEVGKVWAYYYRDTSASQVKLLLYGINAHINGNSWQALATAFSIEDIRELEPQFLLYHKVLREYYEEVYQFMLIHSGRIRSLHGLTLGLSRPFGKMLLRRWRQRQLKLAIWYHTDKKRFDKALEKVQRKMNGINRLIDWYM